MKLGKPLQRKTPLRRAPWKYTPKPRERKPRVHAASGKPKAPREVPARVRDAVSARAGGWCDWCGDPLGTHSDKHHRKLRSRGVEHTIENLVDVHHGCHMWIHENPKEATARGFMVHSWEDPAIVPVLFTDGRVCLARETWIEVEP